MAAPMDVQLRNAQSSLLFMQQEHAHTLQGLHTELQKLQKKCAKLTFEMAMRSDDVDEDQYKEKQKLLECQIKDAEKSIKEMQRRLEEKESSILGLEQQCKAQEKKFQREIKQQKQKLATLSSELDQKASNIAYLTNQLHQMAMTRHNNSRIVLEDRVQLNSPQPPQKPPQKPPSSHRRRTRTSSIDSVTILTNGKVTTSESLDGCDIPSRYTRHLSSPRANNRSPTDNELSTFVARVDRQRSDVEIMPAPPILPPISPFSPQELRTMPRTSGAPSHNPYYTRRGLRISKHRDSEPAEVNSLAVHPVHTTDLHPSAQQSNAGADSV